MAVTFVLGRAGTGKTWFCLDALRAELDVATSGRDAQTRRLLFLVPEQASFQMERALAFATPAGGFWRADVLSFSRLARRLFSANGAEPVMLRRHARAMALRNVVRRGRGGEGGNGPFGAAADTGGFFLELDRLVEELMSENVTPAALRDAAARLKAGPTRRKVETLSQVYGDYLSWVGEERLDAAMHLALLRERIAETPWLRDASVWVDGFAGFTGQELATLVSLAAQCREVTITLLMDPTSPIVRDPQKTSDPLNLFHRTERTYARLRAALTDARIEIHDAVLLNPAATPRFGDAPQLERLERDLSLPPDAKHSEATNPADTNQREATAHTPPQVCVAECVDHRDELRQAANWIRRTIIESDGGLRYRDFALIARDLEPFAEMVAEVFTEFDIPFFLDRRRPLRAHPLSRLIIALMEVVRSDFAPQQTARLLRTGLLPLSRAQSEQIEALVLRHEIRGSNQWSKPHWAFDGESWRLASMRRARRDELNAETDARRVEIFRSIEPLADAAAMRNAPTGAQWARAIHTVVARLGVRERVAEWIAAARRDALWERGETHRLAWEALCDVLEDVHEVLDDVPLGVLEIRQILATSLDDLTLGLAPPTLDQVLVASIERSRHPDIRHAWLFAFNDGIFPAPPGRDELLSTEERTALLETGLTAPAPRRDDVFGERLLAYIACSRPSHGLTISYATVDRAGEPLAPSPLLADVLRALPEVRPRRSETALPPVCTHELARGFLDTRAAANATPQDRARFERLTRAARSRPEVAARLDRLLRGRAYDNQPRPVARAAFEQLAEPEIVWDASPSELESYLQCPFRHFAARRLRLATPRGGDSLAQALGSIAHDVLADVARKAAGYGRSVRDVSDDEWLSWLRETLAAISSDRPADFAERHRRLAFMSAMLDSFLTELVLVHAERYRRGACEPYKAEWLFATGKGADALPSLEIELADKRRVRIHGVIDRVDKAETPTGVTLFVYDYKQKAQSLKLPYLTQSPLQLFTYMLAVQGGHRDEPTTRVAGGFIAPLRPDTKILDTAYFERAEPIEQLMHAYKPRGALSESAVSLLDADIGTERSAVLAAQRKKSGELYKNSDTRPQPALDQTLELARLTIAKTAKGVVQGAIDIAPLDESRRLPCNYCDFKPVCRFERGENRIREASNPRDLPNARSIEEPA